MKLNHKAMAVEALHQSQLMAIEGLWVCALAYAEEALECARMHGDRTLRGHCAYVVECLHKLQPCEVTL